MALVSIIIPSYNYSHTIAETLNSVINQTYTNWEALVIDDGSIDNTKKVVKFFASKDTRIAYYYQDNKGLSAARNKGISFAKGEYLIFLDSDDILLPTMVEKCIKKFKMNAKYNLVYTGWYYGSHNLSKKISTAVPSRDLVHPFPILSIGNIAPCHSIMLKSEVLNYVGNFDESLKSCEDWDLWLRIARIVDVFGIVNQPLCVYRMSQNSMSRNPQVFFDAAKTVLNRALMKEDLRVTMHNTSIKLVSLIDHKLAVIRWLMINVGVYIFNNKLEDGKLFFDLNINGYEKYVTSASFNDMISYLSFSEEVSNHRNENFYKINAKNLMIFLAWQEESLRMPGLASEAFLTVMDKAGYSWKLILNNLTIRKTSLLLANKILNRISLKS